MGSVPVQEKGLEEKRKKPVPQEKIQDDHLLLSLFKFDKHTTFSLTRFAGPFLFSTTFCRNAACCSWPFINAKKY
jgi:hypothetical protein